jgi:hypothetical protein
VLSYLLWERYSFGSQSVQIEIDGPLFRGTNGWRFPEEAQGKWIDLPANAVADIETALEKSNYWKWQSSYLDPDILDGTTWSIKVRAGRTGNRRKNSYGINLYPEKFSEIEAEIDILERHYAEHLLGSTTAPSANPDNRDASSEFYYLDERGRKSDAALHDEILDNPEADLFTRLQTARRAIADGSMSEVFARRLYGISQDIEL